MIGEIGGSAEEAAAKYIAEHVKKPVGGWSASSPVRPHLPVAAWATAGAIISGGEGTAEEKMKAMSAAGIHVVKSPAEMGEDHGAALGQVLTQRACPSHPTHRVKTPERPMGTDTCY